MKPVLMIHEVDESIFNKPLEDFVLTFDDGLYSQYKFIEAIDAIDTDKIFFISTDVVACESTNQHADVVPSHVAHNHYFKNDDRSCFMKWSQILDIQNRYRCSIGGHGHRHIPYNNFDMIDDYNEMQRQFMQHEISIDSFCFPYNIRTVAGMALLTKNKIQHVYGSERIDVSDI